MDAIDRGVEYAVFLGGRAQGRAYYTPEQCTTGIDDPSGRTTTDGDRGRLWRVIITPLCIHAEGGHGMGVAGARRADHAGHLNLQPFPL